MDSPSPYYLDELNPQQRAAVEYLDGPELVIAGAGSGKTRVLTYKIVHLLAHGYEPWRILALTFTNKAAGEMRERITAKVGPDAARRLWMGTFHSIFARILRSHADRIGFASNFTIYDAQDSRNLIKTIIRDMNLDEKVYKATTIASIISNAKNALQSAQDYASDREANLRDRRAERPLTATIFRGYTERLRVANAMDFDDLLYYTHVLLRDNDDIRRHYTEFFRYVLVDEYQDTNYAQHAIISHITGCDGNLCVVGDDAQSIYSFRGANIANILGLKRQYPNLEMFKLEQNYRSTENIINAAGSLIEKNIEQIPKNVFSTNGPGQRIEVVECFSDLEEASLVASRISQRHTEGGEPYSEIAILYRTNAQSRVLEESLRRRSIPYRIYGGQSFFGRKEVKDAVAYLRLALNPADEEALKRIINIPARKIGATTLAHVVNAAVSAGVSLYDVLSDMDRYPVPVNKPTRTRLEAFAALLDRIAAFARENNARDTLQYVYEQTGLEAMYATDNTPENISKRENLVEFFNYAAQFVEGKEEEGLEDETGLSAFMAEVSLATDADTENAEEAEGTETERVTLMTIHAAKGLEFGSVFIVGVEEDLLPSGMSNGSPKEIEEERRLLYVALTRAKRFCMMSFAKSRYRNGQTAITSPSRFLRDIDGSYLKLMTGTHIDRPQQRNPFQSQSFRSPRFTTPRTPGLAATRTVAPPSSRPAPTPQRVDTGDSIPQIHASAELRTDMRIIHSRFGKGTITAIDADNPGGARITVIFETEGTKILLLKFAKFAII